MAIECYFPYCDYDQNDADSGGIMQLSIDENRSPGLLPADFKVTYESFNDDLNRIAKKYCLQAQAVNAHCSLLSIDGPSGTGCAHFIAAWRPEASEEKLKIAISVDSRFHCDELGHAISEATSVSHVPKKIEICKNYNLDILVLSREDEKEVRQTKGIEIVDLDRPKPIYTILSDAKGKLIIALAGKEWDTKLAAWLDVERRAPSLQATSRLHNRTGDRTLAELYLAAIMHGAGEVSDSDAKMLRDIFNGLPEPVMEPNTFPSRILYENDPGSESYRDKFFGPGSTVLCGPTGAGKTTVAKALLLQSLVAEKQAIYVAPTRALVYEVYYYFQKLLTDMREIANNLDKTDPGHIDILNDYNLADQNDLILSTGEKNENDGRVLRGDYALLFSVYEKANLFINTLAFKNESEAPSRLIIDELHMLCDPYRGGILDLFQAKFIRSEIIRLTESAALTAITTEEASAKEMMKFLTSLQAAVPGENIPLFKPTLIQIEERPVPVRHYLYQTGIQPMPVCDMRSSRPVMLTDERRLKQRFRSAEFDRPTGNPEYFDPSVMLASACPETKRSHRKVIGVINSISTIHSFVKRLVKQRVKEREAREERGKQINYCDPEILKKLERGLEDAFITSEERITIEGGVRHGIFVYYAPLDERVRELMAEAFKAPSEVPQVMLTTDALAYGVNLPADALYLTSIRETGDQDQYISRNLYFNVLGRVGRLGKTDVESRCAAFVVLTETGKRRDRDISHIMQKYYGKSNPEAFRVATIARDDIRQILDEHTADCLDCISFATFRSGMDALRFENLPENKTATVQAVRAFLKTSMGGWQLCQKNEDGERRLEQLLTELFKRIHEADGFREMPLIECKNSSGPQWRITSLAEALIDTGVRWTAIEPLGNWIVRLNRLATEFGVEIPIEMLIPGLLVIAETWELCRAFDVLSKKRTVGETSQESNERARNWLRHELEELLPDKSQLPVGALMKEIDEFVREKGDELRISTKDKEMPDHHTRLNSFSRILTAILAWARGESPDYIKQFAKAELRDPTDVASFNYRHGEKIHWMCMLALRFFSKTKKDRRLVASHEGGLQMLALRMRYGLPADCIPLVGWGKSSIQRKKLLAYRKERGLTSAVLLRNDFDSYKRLWKSGELIGMQDGVQRELDFKTYSTLRNNAIRYYSENGANFCALLTRGSLKEESRSALKRIEKFYKEFPALMREGRLFRRANAIESLKEAIALVPSPEDFETSFLANGDLLIRPRSRGRASLILSFLNPFYSRSAWEKAILGRIRDAGEEATLWGQLLGQLNKGKERKHNYLNAREHYPGLSRGEKPDLEDFTFFALAESEEAREKMARFARCHKASAELLVFLPWNCEHSFPSPQTPTLTLASTLLLLRQLADAPIEAILDWQIRQKEANRIVFPIQSLIAADAPEAVEGLRDSLEGDIRQAVLQMDDAIGRT